MFLASHATFLTSSTSIIFECCFCSSSRVPFFSFVSFGRVLVAEKVAFSQALMPHSVPRKSNRLAAQSTSSNDGLENGYPASPSRPLSSLPSNIMIHSASPNISSPRKKAKSQKSPSPLRQRSSLSPDSRFGLPTPPHSHSNDVLMNHPDIVKDQGPSLRTLQLLKTPSRLRKRANESTRIQQEQYESASKRRAIQAETSKSIFLGSHPGQQSPSKSRISPVKGHVSDLLRRAVLANRSDEEEDDEAYTRDRIILLPTKRARDMSKSRLLQNGTTTSFDTTLPETSRRVLFENELRLQEEQMEIEASHIEVVAIQNDVEAPFPDNISLQGGEQEARASGFLSEGEILEAHPKLISSPSPHDLELASPSPSKQFVNLHNSRSPHKATPLESTPSIHPSTPIDNLLSPSESRERFGGELLPMESTPFPLGKTKVSGRKSTPHPGKEMKVRASLAALNSPHKAQRIREDLIEIAKRQSSPTSKQSFLSRMQAVASPLKQQERELSTILAVEHNEDTDDEDLSHFTLEATRQDIGVTPRKNTQPQSDITSIRKSPSKVIEEVKGRQDVDESEEILADDFILETVIVEEEQQPRSEADHKSSASSGTSSPVLMDVGYNPEGDMRLDWTEAQQRKQEDSRQQYLSLMVSPLHKGQSPYRLLRGKESDTWEDTEVDQGLESDVLLDEMEDDEMIEAKHRDKKSEVEMSEEGSILSEESEVEEEGSLNDSEEERHKALEGENLDVLEEEGGEDEEEDEDGEESVEDEDVEQGLYSEEDEGSLLETDKRQSKPQVQDLDADDMSDEQATDDEDNEERVESQVEAEKTSEEKEEYSEEESIDSGREKSSEEEASTEGIEAEQLLDEAVNPHNKRSEGPVSPIEISLTRALQTITTKISSNESMLQQLDKSSVDFEGNTTLWSSFKERARFLSARDGMVEVTSLNREAAARATAILKLYHKYVQYGMLDTEFGDDEAESSNLLDQEDLTLRRNTLQNQLRSFAVNDMSETDKTLDQVLLEKEKEIKTLVKNNRLVSASPLSAPTSFASPKTPLLPGAFPKTPASKIKAKRHALNFHLSMDEITAKCHSRCPPAEVRLEKFDEKGWRALDAIMKAEITSVANGLRAGSGMEKGEALFLAALELKKGNVVKAFLEAYRVQLSGSKDAKEWSEDRVQVRLVSLLRSFLIFLQQKYPELEIDADLFADTTMISSADSSKQEVDMSGLAETSHQVPFQLVTQSTPAPQSRVPITGQDSPLTGRDRIYPRLPSPTLSTLPNLKHVEEVSRANNITMDKTSNGDTSEGIMSLASKSLSYVYSSLGWRKGKQVESKDKSADLSKSSSDQSMIEVRQIRLPRPSQSSSSFNTSSFHNQSQSQVNYRSGSSRLIRSGISSGVDPTALVFLSPHTHALAKTKMLQLKQSREARKWSPRSASTKSRAKRDTNTIL